VGLLDDWRVGLLEVVLPVDGDGASFGGFRGKTVCRHVTANFCLIRPHTQSHYRPHTQSQHTIALRRRSCIRPTEIKMYFASTNEVVFSSAFVCLLAGLRQTTHNRFLKMAGKVAHGPKKKHRWRIRILRILKFPKIHEFLRILKLSILKSIKFKLSQTSPPSSNKLFVATHHLIIGLKILWCQQ